MLVRRNARLGIGLAATVLTIGLVTEVGAAGAGEHSPAVGTAPACAPATGFPPVRTTTITTIQQAYQCVFAHYYSGATLDDRTLLVGAFAALTQALEHLGLDRPTATLPPLTGDRRTDWAGFSAEYQKILAVLPTDPLLRQALAAATIRGLVASLNDNHARWEYVEQPPGSTPADAYGLGITTSPPAQLADAAPQETVPPLFVTAVQPGSPAAQQGMRPGDVIASVNGVQPFADGVPSQGVINWLDQHYPQAQSVRLAIQRPATGRTKAVVIKPATYRSSATSVHSKLLDSDNGNIAYVELPGFFPGAADAVLRAIANLAKGNRLHGVVLDLRGNGGGDPAEDAKLLSAFRHGGTWSYDCDMHGGCTANGIPDTTKLLHLPLVVLTDRGCASGCDAFSAAVKDLRLGRLVGTRTAGLVSGPAAGYLLDDNSLLLLPPLHEMAANREIINGIGVAPDYYVPLTATALSEGRDADVQKALTLFAR